MPRFEIGETVRLSVDAPNDKSGAMGIIVEWMPDEYGVESSDTYKVRIAPHAYREFFACQLERFSSGGSKVDG